MFKLSYQTKVLYAFSTMALVPLVLLALFSFQYLHTVESTLRNSAIEALDHQAADKLELRAVMVANEVSSFLREVEDDLAALVQLAATPENYLWFSRTHRRAIWQRVMTEQGAVESRPVIPLYSELAFIGADGRERLRVVGDQLVNELRDVSHPENTTYLTETYFNVARDLPDDQIHVSHLTGWHVSKAEQLNGARTPEEAVGGARYKGVIRFAKALRGADRSLQGVVVISVDHRHLMEFTQHITPTEERFVAFPSYQSGNYAFMFDDEGWIITHPKFWDIRGLDRQGHLVPPYTERSTKEQIEKGTIPYNLGQAAFVHPNYPEVHKAILGGRSGVIDVTNVGGSQKIMAFAPIFYNRGVYAEKGVFGGITIGAELRQFHKSAEQTSTRIKQLFTSFVSGTWTLVLLTALLVIYAAFKLSRNVTEPLSKLISGTQQMAKGNLATRVEIESPSEVVELANAFNTMARQLNERRERLLKTLSDLRRSRLEIQRERDFNQTIVENVEAGILTLDTNNHVTSLNGPAMTILNLENPKLEVPVEVLLEGWPEFLPSLLKGLQQPRWSEYVSCERDARTQTFRLSLHALTSDHRSGRILTIEDLTERVNMRQQMARIERLASLGRLSAGIAHEVRNPLTGISLLLDELHDRMLSRPGDQGLIQKALHEIERLEGLVNELLTFAAQPETRLAETDLAEALRDTLFLIKKQCQQHRVTLVEEIDDSLPHLRADRDRLKQAFLNLLTNALDAMPDGGTIRVQASWVGKDVRVAISDTGEGIPPEKLNLIFEPFFTTKGEGTGLGLSITHAIIANHGGRIEVESKLETGSTFVLYFPVSGQK